MSRLLIKQISILSAIFGAILGILSLIPFIRNFTSVAVMIFMAPIVIIYLKKLNILHDITVQTGMIMGAITGIVSIIAFTLAFTPFDLLFSLFIKDGFIFIMSSFIKNAGIFNYVMLLSFICILSGITNAFSGLTTAYIYDFLGKIKD